MRRRSRCVYCVCNHEGEWTGFQSIRKYVTKGSDDRVRIASCIGCENTHAPALLVIERYIMPRKTHHVVPNPDGGWDIRKGGSDRASGHFPTKSQAEKEGRKISRNQGSELVIHKRNGRISRSDSHGNDPCPPRG